MNKLVPFWLLLIAFSTISTTAQIKNIKLDETILGSYPPSEPSIAINLQDTNNIVAASILDKVYTTKDGGKTWTKESLKSSYGVYGDPAVISSADGCFYYFHLSDPSGKGWQGEEILDRMVVQKSKNGGTSWNNGYSIGLNHPKDQDKEWPAINHKNGNIYLTWTQFDKYGSKETSDKSNILFSKSTEGGKNWSAPIAINELQGDCIDDDKTVEGAVPTVGPEGEIYVAWSYNNKIYFDRSTDEGKTWLKKDVEVANQVGGWALDIPGINRCNGMPITICDVSNSPYNGTIYVNYADQSNGEDDTDIWLVKSTDKGSTWSAPKRVNDDISGKQQFLTWMSIDQTTGYIYTVFYDRRNHEDLNTDVYLAYSTDGGETFINKKISASPFIPSDDVFFGDYTNIAAHKGRICPIWTNMIHGKTSIWTAVISEGDLGIER